MNKTPTEAKLFAGALAASIGMEDSLEVVVCPPSIDIPAVIDVLKDTKIKVGAQNIYPKESGAFTGEISTTMLKDLGAEYVIAGHSERRHIFGESNALINEKIKFALKENLTPIFCIGETLEEREAGRTFDVLRDQIIEGLREINTDEVLRIIVAYEPVWAIGTGKVATPEQADEAMGYVRKLIGELYGQDVSDQMVILYGGSIKPENFDSLIKMENIDGGLVGGASLKESFIELVKIAKKYL
ncbi:triosephosphate isomerase [Kosmotoga arenicorallina S304]|uniref:Triosephosphate isomerase n=1 Tax=Kosmotoga arenicorallina S304 TaxID=1453497 RepID=A0A182C7S1_9BACT|nr:triose-phosphate isomerase [Kosmotoga arenicorallina]OAA31754.1 triosephosphate isomerase [Kosmotoga arenicorallina S304]